MCETKQHVISVILKVTTGYSLFTDCSQMVPHNFKNYHFHEIAKTWNLLGSNIKDNKNDFSIII